jgi:hypothetical protein
MRKLLILALAVFLLSFFPDAHAQMSRRSIKKNNKRIFTYRGKASWFGKEKQYDMISISASALNYFGDLSPRPGLFSTDISFTRPAVSLSYGHRFGPRYTITGSFMYGTLKGSDSQSADQGDTNNGIFRYQRNLSFRNRIKELSVIASFDLFENSATYISRAEWTPYLFLGAAALLHNPQGLAPATDLDGNPLQEGEQWVDLQPLGTEGQYAALQDGDANQGATPYKKLVVAIPMGIGVRFRVNEVLDFAAEFGFRYLFTDYLDDVSKNYVDLGVFGPDELAKAMSYRTSEVATPTDTYIGRDGKTYNVVSGYGREDPNNLRGNKDNRDIYMVTTLKLSYILGKSFRKAKFR